MSNRLFQGIIHQMHDSIDRVIGVIDDTAHVVACSDLSKLDTSREYLSIDLAEGRTFVRDGYTYKPFGTGRHPEFAVFVEGADEMAGVMPESSPFPSRASSSITTRSMTVAISSKT